MKNLTLNETLLINGGTDDCHPIGSDDPNVQSGYGIGWHIGHAIGNTIQQFGDITEAMFGWLK